MRYVVVLLCLVAALAGCQHEPPPYTSRYTTPPPSSVPKPRITVAIIGDSYTAGSDMGGNGAQGWPTLAEMQLRGQGMDINPAVGAERDSGYVERGLNGGVFADQVPYVVRPEDRLVVLFGSLNDENIPPEELSAAVQRTLADTKAAAPEAGLLILGPPWTDANPPATVLQVRDLVKTGAETVGATFVDPIAEGWFVDHPELIASDGVHPTDAGHQYMADKIAPLIAQQLQALPAP